MKEADLLVKGKYVLPMTRHNDMIKDAGVVVRDSTIIDIGSTRSLNEKYHFNKTINAVNGIVMPGLMNTHTHAAMVMFRGLADDLPLDTWLNKYIWPAELKHLNPEFIDLASDLACLEMIKAGITCFNNMYFFEERTAESAQKAGIRVHIGEVILNFPTSSYKTVQEALQITEKQILKYKDNNLVDVCIAPHSIYTTDEKLLKAVKEMAEKHNTKIHIHLSETEDEYNDCLKTHAKTPVEYLDSINFLSNNIIAAHGVWLSASDLEILKKRSVSISHNPVSNMKLASGVAKIAQMTEMGINVALGTDGAASNNSLDMFSEMKMCSLLQKVTNQKPTDIKAEEAIMMATRNAAISLGKEQETGTLEIGKKADIITINLNRPHLTPIYNPYSHLVYCSNASDVMDVVVDGKILMKARKVLVLDEKGVLNKANKYHKKIK